MPEHLYHPREIGDQQNYKSTSNPLGEMGLQKLTEISETSAIKPTSLPATYPIFFRQHGSIEAGYPTTWVWQDRALSSEDVGPFDTYEDALANWAQTNFLTGLERDLKALDIALGSPVLNPPTLSEADTERALKALNQAEGQLSQQAQPAAAVAVSMINPQSQSGKFLLAWGLKDAAYMQLLDMGLELVEQMSCYRDGDGVTVALEQLQAGGVH